MASARAVLLAAVLMAAVALCAAQGPAAPKPRAATAVPITIVWDNTAAEVPRQERETRKNMAAILCGNIPQEAVVLPAASALRDESNLADSKTTGVYYCRAADDAGAKRIYAACESRENKEEFADEMEDDTDFPELEVETISCSPNFVQQP